MATIAILGVGSLAGMMLKGLRGSGHRFILSAERSTTAGALAAEFGAEVAADNQAAVDAAEAVFVSLPAATGGEIVETLRFRAGQRVLSAVAGLSLARLGAAVAPALAAVTIMPGYSNALGVGSALLSPADPFWAEVLGHTGLVLTVDDPDHYTAGAVYGGFSGALYGFMAQAIAWFEAQGLPEPVARGLVATALRGNAQVLLSEPTPVAEIAARVTTPGGISEQILNTLKARGALDAWDEGMAAVHARLKGSA